MICDIIALIVRLVTKNHMSVCISPLDNRGGRTHSKCHLILLHLIAFFQVVFHITLNNFNTNNANGGVEWGIFDNQTFLHISRQESQCFTELY